MSGFLYFTVLLINNILFAELLAVITLHTLLTLFTNSDTKSPFTSTHETSNRTTTLPNLTSTNLFIAKLCSSRKVKASHSLPSVEPGADPGVPAVSPQVGCHYFPPGLPSQPSRRASPPLDRDRGK